LLKEAQHSPGMQTPSPAALGQPQEFADPVWSTVANPKQNRSSAET